MTAPLSDDYLTAPVDFHVAGIDPGRTWRRLSTGLIEIRRYDGWVPGEPGPAQRPVSGSTARLVTFDASAAIAGLQAAKFGDGDAIFISAALAADLQAVRVVSANDSLFEEAALNYAGWRVTEPVPLDAAVLRISEELSSRAIDDLARRWVDRTDLLCAATALLYGAALYTAEPERYRSIGMGLEVVPYGAVPSPDLGQSDAAQPWNLSRLRAEFLRGTHFGPLAQKLLISPEVSDRETAEFIIDVFMDTDPKRHRSWQAGIVAMAQHLQRVRNTPADVRREAVNAVFHSGYPRVDPRAYATVGHWLRWPEDIIDEALDELVYEDRDSEDALGWYRGHLVMAGLSPREVELELRRVIQGESEPTRERIEALREPRSAGAEGSDEPS